MLAFIAESKIVRPSSYIFAPHVSRKLREKMRQIILLLYNDEAYFRYWYPRYGINRGAARQMHKFVKENALGVGGESNTKARNNFQVRVNAEIINLDFQTDSNLAHNLQKIGIAACVLRAFIVISC